MRLEAEDQGRTGEWSHAGGPAAREGLIPPKAIGVRGGGEPGPVDAAIE